MNWNGCQSAYKEEGARGDLQGKSWRRETRCFMDRVTTKSEPSCCWRSSFYDCQQDKNSKKLSLHISQEQRNWTFRGHLPLSWRASKGLGQTAKNNILFSFPPTHKGEICGILLDFCSRVQLSHEFPHVIFLHSPWICLHP